MQTIIQENTFEKARKQIQEAQTQKKQIIFSSDNDELNRKVLEKLPIEILLINLSKRKDFQKQRNSGFNQVLAKIAKKNKVTIGINLNEIINANSKEKIEILARIEQNVKLCNKNKIQMKFITQKSQDQYDLKALGLVLGMPTWMIKEI
jgi:RNase P/RNase MRP subunit p30